MKALPLKAMVDPRRPLTYGIVQAGDDSPNGVPYIRPVDMDGHKGVSVESLQRTDPAIAASYKRSALRPGDLVVSIGPSYGKTMVVPPELMGANLTQGTARVAVAEGVSSSFIRWALQSSEVTAFWDAASGGSTFRALNLGPLGQTPIPVHSPERQRAIADYLDRETAQIDAFIAKNEGLIALFTERRAAVVDRAFEPLRTSMTRLKYRARIQTGVTLGGDGNPEDPEWPYLRVANVQVGRVDLQDVKFVRVPEMRARQSMLSAGDVLMTEGGDRDKLGRGALWNGEVEPMLHQNHVFAVKVGRQLEARFLTRWLDSSAAREYFETTAVQTTNLASTNKTLVGNLAVPLCSVPAQIALVATLDGSLERIDKAIETAARSIELARERRAALISAAVTGEIDVEGAA